MDAPAEYHGLGAALSTNRRNVAEYGTVHITARKLGALFEAILPETPRLIEAYGKRTSEIAESDVAQLHSASEKGIFGDYTGPDGTSIWAAATSGRSVISMHLLACMLYVVHLHCSKGSLLRCVGSIKRKAMACRRGHINMGRDRGTPETAD
jgi:hypothetical protein